VPQIRSATISASRTLPLILDLHKVRDVRAALDVLQDTEKFLEHLEKQLTPGSLRSSGVWRFIFDRIADQLCERKRSMKKTMCTLSFAALAIICTFGLIPAYLLPAYLLFRKFGP
jgi:hypothetical protein